MPGPSGLFRTDNLTRRNTNRCCFFRSSGHFSQSGFATSRSIFQLFATLAAANSDDGNAAQVPLLPVLPLYGTSQRQRVACRPLIGTTTREDDQSRWHGQKPQQRSWRLVVAESLIVNYAPSSTGQAMISDGRPDIPALPE